MVYNLSIFFILIASLPAQGQEAQKIGNRANQDVSLCKNLGGGSEVCATVDASGDFKADSMNTLNTLRLGETGVTNGLLTSNDDIAIRPDADGDGNNFITFRDSANAAKLSFSENDGDTELTVDEIGDCGVGSLCSYDNESISTIFISVENVAALSSTGSAIVNRSGNVVSIAGGGTIDPTSSTRTRWAIDLATLPTDLEPPSNFTSDFQASGSLSVKANVGTNNTSCTIESRNGTKHLVVDCRNLTDQGVQAFHYSAMYRLQ